MDLAQPEDAPAQLGERLWYVNINSTYEVLVNRNSEIISCTTIEYNKVSALTVNLAVGAFYIGLTVLQPSGIG